MSFVWLASYPKSGNTWVRVFLSNYLSESGSGWEWNKQLSGAPAHLNRYSFDENMGISSADIPAEALNEYRRNYTRQIIESAEKPRFAKTHEAYSDPRERVGKFPIMDGCKAIYLVRNPLDLTASFAHHQNRTIAQILPLLADPEAKITTQGPFFDEQMGSWSAHVECWTKQTGIPVCVLRYEDLIDKPSENFAKIVRFCGLDFSKEKIDTAIAASSFDRLRANEQKSAFKERPPMAASFFRSGKVGGWREELTADQADQIIAEHGEVMQQLGYL